MILVPLQECIGGHCLTYNQQYQGRDNCGQHSHIINIPNKQLNVIKKRQLGHLSFPTGHIVGKYQTNALMTLTPLAATSHRPIYVHGAKTQAS